MRFGWSPMTLCRTTNLRMQARGRIAAAVAQTSGRPRSMTNFERKKNDGSVFAHWCHHTRTLAGLKRQTSQVDYFRLATIHRERGDSFEEWRFQARDTGNAFENAILRS